MEEILILVPRMADGTDCAVLENGSVIVDSGVDVVKHGYKVTRVKFTNTNSYMKWGRFVKICKAGDIDSYLQNNEEPVAYLEIDNRLLGAPIIKLDAVKGSR